MLATTGCIWAVGRGPGSVPTPPGRQTTLVSMQDYEKLGVFYLGRAEKGLLLYESKHLVTHAVCVGMTGSGKTGRTSLS